MQERVAYNRYQVKRDKKQIAKPLTLFMAFSIATIILIFTVISLIFQNNTNAIFSAKKVYMLSLFDTQSKNQIYDFTERVKAIGGAGYVYNNGQKYFVLASAYFEKDDADKVKGEATEGFKPEVVEITFDNIKSGGRLLIKKHRELLKAFEFIHNSIKLAEENVYKLDRGEGVSSVYSGLVKENSKAKELLDGLGGLNETGKAALIKAEIENTLETIISLNEGLLSAIYSSSSVASYARFNMISQCFNYEKLRKSINK